VRFKLPEENNESFKIEFRPLELQSSLIDNLRINCYMVLLTRALIVFKPYLLIPLSYVDVNMNTAHEVEPVQEKYFFPNFDVKETVRRFISNNNLTETAFEEGCVTEDSEEHETPEKVRPRFKSVTLGDIICSESKLDVELRTLDDIFFGPNGLDRLIQC
jgi:hypothetical protein